MPASDNQLDNNNEKSESSANCRWQDVRASKRKRRRLSLRKCKSESNVRRRHEIDEMGSNVSRSRSLDNIETDSIVYEALTDNKAAKRDENSLCDFESEDDYKLLQSSEDELADEEPCEAISPAHSALDVHDSAETASSDLNVEGEAASCQDHSTREIFTRLSAPYKSLTSDNAAREAPKACRSTTLPKTRSRQIDSTKHSRISHAPEHTAAVIPSTSGTGKNNFFPLRPDFF